MKQQKQENLSRDLKILEKIETLVLELETLSGSLGQSYSIKENNPTEKTRRPHMSDARARFTERVIDYSKTQPEILPNEVDEELFSEMMVLFKRLFDVDKKLSFIKTAVLKSRNAVGSQSYFYACRSYDQVKILNKLGKPGFTAMFNDLKEFFRKTKTTKK